MMRLQEAKAVAGVGGTLRCLDPGRNLYLKTDALYTVFHTQEVGLHILDARGVRKLGSPSASFEIVKKGEAAPYIHFYTSRNHTGGCCGVKELVLTGATTRNKKYELFKPERDGYLTIFPDFKLKELPPNTFEIIPVTIAGTYITDSGVVGHGGV